MHNYKHCLTHSNEQLLPFVGSDVGFCIIFLWLEFCFFFLCIFSLVVSLPRQSVVLEKLVSDTGARCYVKLYPGLTAGFCFSLVVLEFRRVSD